MPASCCSRCFPLLFLERRFDNRGSAIAFAAIVLLGFLSHLTMAETVVILVAWTSWLVWSRTGSLASTNREVGLIFAPAFLAVLRSQPACSLAVNCSGSSLAAFHRFRCRLSRKGMAE